MHNLRLKSVHKSKIDFIFYNIYNFENHNTYNLITQQVMQNKIIINVAMFSYMLIQLFIIYMKVSASFVIKSVIND